MPRPTGTKQTHKGYKEVVGILCLGFAILSLLSLISYDPKDLGWHVSKTNEQILNSIGPFGAYLSEILISSFGMGAYLFPPLFLGASLTCFFQPQVEWKWKLIWAALLLISAAAVLDLQTLFGTSWKNNLNTFGVGGWLGLVLNDFFFERLLGRAGAGIVLGTVYTTSLILLIDFKPMAAAKSVYEWAVATLEQREQERLEHADPLERLEAERRRIERKARELQKAAKKAGLPEGAAEPRVTDAAALEEKKPKTEPLPEPKITDAAIALPPAPAVKKPKKEASTVKEAPSLENYTLPGIDLLLANSSKGVAPVNEEELRANSRLLVSTLLEFGIEVTPGEITRGATITRYEVYPAPGVRVDKIRGLQRDIARAMKAEKINILAPIPGKDSVGIEVANSSKVPIVLRDLFETGEWASSPAKIPIALGKDVYGQTLVADLAEMPHLLIAGTTGSGKSVCVNCIVLSMLYRFSPDELRLILIDPKQVEMQVYNSIPHLVVPVVTDPKKVLVALRWVLVEMEKRYQILAKVGVRNITAFNGRVKDKKAATTEALDLKEKLQEAEKSAEPEDPQQTLNVQAAGDDLVVPDRLPYIVVIVDELADLMMTAPADVETAIARISQKARAAGIHLIVATQTPRREVVTGVIKTNIPSRIAFQVPSALDSRVILDESGAENLLGKGDMLYLPPGSAKLLRGQGAFVSDDEVKSVVDFTAGQALPAYEQEIHQKLAKPSNTGDDEVCDEDKELIVKAWEVIVQEKRASTSTVQRRLRIGYNRAAWIVDYLCSRGVLGGSDGAKPRDILVNPDTFDIESIL
jgi:S-DNA-T family DNA segregation ATPase FtsK/SpoIIIE